MPREIEDEDWNEDIEQSPAKKRPSHIRHCCAEGCTSKGYRLLIAGERVQYFPFPLFDKVLCQRWAAAVKLPSHIPHEKAFVCSKHFRSGDYKARPHEDSKRTLRRTAIPSLQPVVPQGKSRKVLLENTSDESEDEETNLKEITTLVTKDTNTHGDPFTLLVVKDTVGEDTDEVEEVQPKILQTKKVPFRCEEFLNMGPPFPWRQQGLIPWVSARLTSHEEQLEKNRTLAADEEEQCRELEEKIDELLSTLAHFHLKSFMGRVTFIQRVKQLLQ